jgi:hypothetical protein
VLAQTASCWLQDGALLYYSSCPLRLLGAGLRRSSLGCIFLLLLLACLSTAHTETVPMRVGQVGESPPAQSTSCLLLLLEGLRFNGGKLRERVGNEAVREKDRAAILGLPRCCGVPVRIDWFGRTGSAHDWEHFAVPLLLSRARNKDALQAELQTTRRLQC